MGDGHLEPRLAAVILAGGRATRLGGRDKPMVSVGGVPMLRRVLAAVTHAMHQVGAGPIVVVGPEREGLPDAILVVREQPPGGGPAAAAAAGLMSLGTGDGLVALLAADLPFVTAEAVAVLVRAVGDKDGAVFVDPDGRRQLLCGVWRVEALQRAVRDIGEPAGKSVRRLVEGLDVREVRWERERPPYFDCDTEEDLRAVDDNVLGHWLIEAAAALGVAAPSPEERTAVLDLARDVAHNVARPGAPLTAFLLGVAVGRGADAQVAAQMLSRLATRGA